MFPDFRSRGALTRRRFVTGLGCVASAAASRRATASPARFTNIPPSASNHYALTVGCTSIAIDDKRIDAATVDATIPGPVLRWREGDMVSLDVRNTMSSPTSIHWHGIRLPADMDGVPGLSFAGIPPGETFTYRFRVQQSGTYWYHSHSAMQEAQGLYGAIIIDPLHDRRPPVDADYVLLLSEWTDVDPDDIVSNLKMQDDYYVFRQRTLASLPREARKAGSLLAALDSRLQWSQMRMAATDISDVTGIIYSYLINGHAPGENWTALFQPGQQVRLRIINGSTMTFFDIRIPGLEMIVVAADGNDVEPVPVDEFRIGVAETYDIIVRPTQSRAYTIFAQTEDRTGYARATLAPQPGMSAAIPPMDPRPVRTMVDMGMGNMMSDNSMASMKMASPKATPEKTPPAKTPLAKTPPDDMAGMDMKDMDMKGMDMGDMDMSGTDMKGMSMPAKPPAPPLEIDDPGPPPLNVENQNIAKMPVDRTGSPGDGLENNGRRVLNYRDLRATRPGTDPRPPSREIIMHLTGNMERYIWGFNGRKFSESGPIRLRRNERVRFTLINDTMMEHPIHLHGLWSELENGQDAYRPYKHTIISQPGSRLSYLVTADVPGLWAWHCHLIYHMDLGMFRTVQVS